MSRKTTPALVAVALLGAFAGAASAAPPDFTVLSSAVDFSTVGTALLAVAALKVTPLVVRWGASKVLGMIGR